ncbi:MAG: FAD/NAD(P)-binding protein [Magnetococcales bacterium]|nr:FAD/NAD(P)-binding protein [Magnetococcales bacterium]
MSVNAEVADATFDRELYLPQMARVIAIEEMTSREKLFRLELSKPLGHRPGQFVMLSALGIGEAPISISCGPRTDNILEMVIRSVGTLTRVFHTLKPGDKLGVRGPFGSGFHLEEFDGKDVLLIVGGLGLVPLRSLIQPLLARSERLGRITIISGCRTPADELFRDEVKSWSQLDQGRGKIRVLRLVDRPDNLPWDGQVGLVTEPIAALELDPKRTMVALCGPPVMYKFVLLELYARDIPHAQIFVDLERRMKCGIGKCGHCQINHVYCCQDGPVFRVDRIENLPEALQ